MPLQEFDQDAGEAVVIDEPQTLKCWVVFTAEGDPAWYGPQEVDGSEWVEDLPVNAPAMRRVDGIWVERPPRPAPSEAEIAARLQAELPQMRASALITVDDLIQEARLRFVTALPGQEAIYLSKEAEARLYVTTVPEPETLEDFPYLAGEVGITAPTARALAEVWLQRGALFRSRGARTENLRMGARKAIAGAQSRDTLALIVQDLSAQLDALG